jgi:8-oxo-dGTP pyrophosphatase MutT (NUDIX family)
VSGAHKRRAPNAQWVGASILLFSITPNGNVYFLLGQEATHDGYKDSGKWSDFGGGATLNEDAYTCAAREFLEETQRTINPFPHKYGHGPLDASTIVRELKRGAYTARIDFNFLNTAFPKTYTTFLIEIPWDPTLRSRFSKYLRTQFSKSQASTSRYFNFQGKLNSKNRGMIEKAAIQFFSIPRLLGKARHRALTLSTPAKTQDAAPEFRAFFMRRLRKILALVFPKNLAQYQTLDNPDACRALYQGAGVRVSLPKPQSASQPGCWARGARLPIPPSTSVTDTHLSGRIFQNFNTYRKYPNKTARDPVDKIFY